MSFKHKLSVRLALMRDLLPVATLAALVACELPLQLTAPNAVVTRVVVSPRQIALHPNQASQFMAVGLTARGDTASVPMTWSATGGTIVDTFSNGPRHFAKYLPGTLPGNYLVIATDPPATGLADTSSVTVVLAPVVSVTLSPTVATVLVGATLQLAAIPLDSSGTPLSGRVVTWSSSAPALATVSGSGLVTATAVGSTTVVATSEGRSASAAITVTNVPVASVTVSPASATIPVGAVQQLSAVTKDSANNTLTGRVVTWSSSNTAVATVSTSGLVTGQSAGSATITATSEGKNGTSAITVQAPPPTLHAGHYVAPNGSPSGDGSATRPWDLQTALNQPAAVQPGDTVWLRGGTYTGAFGTQGTFLANLNGTAASPIIVRQYPGERAIVRNGIENNSGGGGTGRYVWWWGFEITNPAPSTSSNAMGMNYQVSPGVKYINLIVHDAGGQGLYLLGDSWEINGCISYNNGSNNNLDHGMYVSTYSGPALVQDNIVFNSYAFGLHEYSTPTNITNRGNVLFNNGSINPGAFGYSANLLVGGSIPASRIVVDSNYTYETTPAAIGTGAEVGYATPSNDLQFTNNVVIGGIRSLDVGQPWSSAFVTGNVIYSPGQPLAHLQSASGQAWSGNTFYGSASDNAFLYAGGPATTLANWITQTGLANPGSYGGATPPNIVVVRPNKYEAGRANIVVYNWAGQSSVGVDVSNVLRVGDRYVVQDVQDFFGAPVVSGSYGGGALQLPMAGIPAPVPIGRGTPGPVTGPTFKVFVLIKTP